ncbi:DIS3-like exonuclease 2 [Mytilus edulis]|uniref:DIS3-like exonuclease 2 n=1 Tax=Mytilus edulis TaxID=6550 RepID=UPI0039F0907E
MEFGEEDVGSESDLMACRACGLVFAHSRGLEIHQKRDCGEEPSAKRCRTEDDGVEGTYGYELECYLEDLPATIHVNDLKDLEEKYQENEPSDKANNDNQSDVTLRTEHQGESDSGSQPESTIGNEKSMYLTFQEVMKGGSDVFKNLFTSNDKEKLNSANRILRRTGKVWAIIQLKHSRVCRGSLKLMNQHTALFTPRDSRLPGIMIPLKYCPTDFIKSPKDHINTLFISKIKEWRDNYSYAHGVVELTLGEKGDVNIETEGILREYGVDFSEFTEEMLSSLPTGTWQIPDDEITKRRDFRQKCVFTTDPATARDLDDALSCEQLDDGK